VLSGFQNHIKCSLSDMAKALDISDSHYSRIEAGTANLTALQLNEVLYKVNTTHIDFMYVFNCACTIVEAHGIKFLPVDASKFMTIHKINKKQLQSLIDTYICNSIAGLQILF